MLIMQKTYRKLLRKIYNLSWNYRKPINKSLTTDIIWQDYFKKGYLMFSNPLPDNLLNTLLSESKAFKEECKNGLYVSDGIKKSYLHKKYKSGQSIVDDGLIDLDRYVQKTMPVKRLIGPKFFCLSMDYWYSQAGSTSVDRVGSQNWHTDPEDITMFKVFVYLGDIRSENGPMDYIEGTQYLGYQSPKRPWYKLTGDYYSDSFVQANFDANSIAHLIGSCGDLAVVDTTGLHRGGFGTEERLMAVLTYTSMSTWSSIRYV